MTGVTAPLFNSFMIMWLFSEDEFQSYFQTESINYEVRFKNINTTFVTVDSC